MNRLKKTPARRVGDVVPPTNVERLESRRLFAATPAVTRLDLINATTDTTVGTFVNGAKLDQAGGRHWSVRAIAGAGVASVKFMLNGKVVRTENFAPFSIAGDTNGDYAPWKVPAGQHRLTVVPYTGRNATGVAGVSYVVNFTAVDGSGTTTPVPVIDVTPRAGRQLGGDLNSQSDRVQDLAFIDLVKTTRGFYNVAGRKASNGAIDFARADVNGWPTEDFNFTAVDNSEWPQAVDQGVYKMQFKGPSGATVSSVAGVTVRRLSYTASTGVHVYDITVGANVKKLTLTFRNTGGAVKNVRLLQPGYALSTTKTFADRYLNLLRTVGPTVLRFMEWTKANGDREVNWSDRPKLTDATQAKAVAAGDLQPGKGIAWEYVVQLANELGRSVWINVGAHANDDYVRQLARLFRDQLRSDLNIYVEHSNEVWNIDFEQAGYNMTLAVNEVFAGGSNLNYDNKPIDRSKPGTSNPQANTWGERRHARRTRQIAEIFRQIWVEKGLANPLNKRVRVVLGGQAAGLGRFDNMLAYLRATQGEPKNYLWGIGIAPYFGLNKYNTATATKAQVLEGMNLSVDAYVNGPTISTAFQKANAYGLKLVAYEGGPDTFGATNIANKRAASLDPAMQGIIVRYLNNWYAKGGDLFLYYTIGARSYQSPYGTWSITESYSQLASPKIKAFQQVRG
jgi:hypothetical protein